MPIKILSFISSPLRCTFRLACVARARREFVVLLARDLSRRAEMPDEILGEFARREPECGLRPEARGPLVEPEGVVPERAARLCAASIEHPVSPITCEGIELRAASFSGRAWRAPQAAGA